jgi:hypothetical protein
MLHFVGHFVCIYIENDARNHEPKILYSSQQWEKNCHYRDWLWRQFAYQPVSFVKVICNILSPTKVLYIILVLTNSFDLGRPSSGQMLH